MEASDDQFHEVREWAAVVAQQFENSFVCNDRNQERALPLFEPTELLQGSRQPCGEYFDVIELKGVLLNRLPTHRRIAEKSKQQSYRARFAERATVGSYSIKVLHSDASATTKQHRDAAAAMVIETKFLIHLSHANIIKLYGMTVEGMAALSRPGKQGFFTIMESVLETLEERIDRWMTQGRNDSDNLSRRLEVGEDLSSALVYLSNRKIIFGALRPDNVGFDANYGRLKLINFGNAREESQVHFVNSEVENHNMKILPYTAPEVLCKDKVTRKSDVYSFGIILWTLLSIERPFEGVHASKYIQDVVKGGNRPTLQDSWPIAVCDLMRNCWEHNPKDRPSMVNVQRALEEALVGQFFPEEDPIWKVVPTPPTSIDSSSAEIDELASICQRSISAASRHSTFSGSMSMSISDDNSFSTFWLHEPQPPSLLSPPRGSNSLAMHLRRCNNEGHNTKPPSSRCSASLASNDKVDKGKSKPPLLMTKVNDARKTTGSSSRFEVTEHAENYCLSGKQRGHVTDQRSDKEPTAQPSLEEAFSQLDELASICQRSLSASRHSRSLSISRGRTLSVCRDRSLSASRNSRSPSASRGARGPSVSRHSRSLSLSRHSAYSGAFGDLDSSESSIEIKEPNRNSSSAFFASHSSQMQLLESLVGMAVDDKIDCVIGDTSDRISTRPSFTTQVNNDPDQQNLDNISINPPTTKSNMQKKSADKSEFGSLSRSGLTDESGRTRTTRKKCNRKSNDASRDRLRNSGFQSRRSTFSPGGSNQPATPKLSTPLKAAKALLNRMKPPLGPIPLIDDDEHQIEKRNGQESRTGFDERKTTKSNHGSIRGDRTYMGDEIKSKSSHGSTRGGQSGFNEIKSKSSHGNTRVGRSGFDEIKSKSSHGSTRGGRSGFDEIKSKSSHGNSRGGRSGFDEIKSKSSHGSTRGGRSGFHDDHNNHKSSHRSLRGSKTGFGDDKKSRGSHGSLRGSRTYVDDDLKSKSSDESNRGGGSGLDFSRPRQARE